MHVLYSILENILQNSNAESGIASDPRHLSQNPKDQKHLNMYMSHSESVSRSLSPLEFDFAKYIVEIVQINSRS